MNTNSLTGTQATKAASSALELTVSRLDDEIAALNESLEQLYSRLTPYIAASEPATANQRQPPVIHGTSPCIAKLTTLTDRLVHMNTSLQFLRERLEL